MTTVRTNGWSVGSEEEKEKVPYTNTIGRQADVPGWGQG